ncbi:unnamed protein product [Paramecium octaurelia]|uniref:Uncharacterized protein n=1 Tax=Paramecium octaurelia TaxID=43137 RepID=A0A8S1Y6F6_PAROT|nr:unnamed protein product [Paramecium octaurelia]
MIKFQKLDQPLTSLETVKVTSPQNNRFYIVHPSPIEIQTQTQNFFCGSSELLRQIPSHDKGPKLDSKGQIVRHTLVGSVQQFMLEKQRRQSTGKKPQVKLQTQLQPELEVPPMINNSYTKITEFMSSKDLVKKSPSKVKSKEYQLIQLNEEQVQQEIVDVERRVKINQAETAKLNQEIKQQLNKGDQLKMDAFIRAMTNYENTQTDWEQTKIKVSSRISRKTGQSMNEKIEQFRVKQEVKQLLDHITPIDQKLGNDYWKQGLRSQESTLKRKNPYKYIDKLEEDPNYQIDKKPPVIEIIRAQNSSAKGFRPYSSFTSRFYLDRKLKENEELVKKLIPQNLDEIDQLQLTGQNVMKQEINSVRNPRDSFVKITGSLANSQGGFKTYFKKVPIKQEHQQPDEVIVQNYDKKKMLNTGQFGSLKGYF